MKIPLWLTIIIEITIACGIFVVLVTKTSLFDRAAPERIRPTQTQSSLSIDNAITRSSPATAI